MTDIGTLAISMGLDIAELRRDSARAKKDIKDMSKSMERDINRVNKNFERMSDRFSKDISQLKRSVASLERQMDKMSRSTERSFDRTNKAVKKSSTAFNGFVKTVRAAALGYATVLATMEITQFTSGILKQGVSLDALQRSYKAVTGSAQESDRILSMLGKTADELGLNLNAMEGSYRNILAAAKGTALEGREIERVFLSVAKASAVLGMSADDTSGVLRALMQMISKGNVQAEELRGQLGERLPGAFGMSAEALGVTTQKLSKMLEMGQVAADDLLPKLADVLENRFSAAAKDAGERAGASFERLSNSVIRLQRTLATSGILDFFVELSDSISSVLDESQDDIEEFMKSLNFKEGTENVLALASAFGKLYSVITFGGGIGEFAGYVNALSNEFLNMLKGAKALAEGQITWEEFFGSGNEINAAIDRWEEGKDAVNEFREALTKTSEEGKADIAELFKAFDSPKEAIQSLQNELNKLQKDIDKYIDVFGTQRQTPIFKEQVEKAQELRATILQLQGLIEYGFEVETLKRLGDTFGYIQQKTNEAVKAAEEYQKMLDADPFEVNMGEFAFDSKTRDAALKNIESQKKMLDNFVNYSKSKYQEERDNINKTFRQLYIIYKDNAEVRERLRETLSKRLIEIDEAEKKELKQQEEDYNAWLLKIKIQAIRDRLTAQQEATKQEIEMMNKMVAKEEEQYEWITEIKVENLKEGLKERQRITQKEIEEMNKLMAKEEEAYNFFLNLRNKRFQADVAAYVAEDNKQKAWKTKNDITDNQYTPAALNAIQQYWKNYIDSMNAAMDAEEEAYNNKKQVQINAYKEQERARQQYWIDYITAMNAAMDAEEEAYNWQTQIVLSNFKERSAAMQQYWIDEIASMNTNNEKVKRMVQDINQYYEENVLSNYQARVNEAKRIYDARIEFAKKEGLDTTKIEKAHQAVLAQLWKEETERRKAEYEAQVRAAEEAAREKLRIQQELDLKMIGNLDNVNLTDKEIRMQVDSDSVDVTKNILNEQNELLDDYKKATMSSAEWEIEQLNRVYQHRIDLLGESLLLDKWYSAEYRKIVEKDLEEINQFQEEMLKRMQSELADTFTDIRKNGVDSWQDMLGRFVEIWLRALEEMAAAWAMKNIFGDAMTGKSGDGGWIGTALSFGASLFSGGGSGASTGPQVIGIGGRATGGPVMPREMYEVNEQGPELLLSGGKQFLMMGDLPGFVKPLTESHDYEQRIRSRLEPTNQSITNIANSTNANSLSISVPVTVENAKSLGVDLQRRIEAVVEQTIREHS